MRKEREIDRQIDMQKWRERKRRAEETVRKESCVKNEAQI
jgi:hypothetical protein